MSDDTNFVPRLDGTGSLGRTDKRWNEVHAKTYHGDGSNLTGLTIEQVTGAAPADSYLTVLEQDLGNLADIVGVGNTVTVDTDLTYTPGQYITITLRIDNSLNQLSRVVSYNALSGQLQYAAPYSMGAGVANGNTSHEGPWDINIAETPTPRYATQSTTEGLRTSTGNALGFGVAGQITLGFDLQYEAGDYVKIDYQDPQLGSGHQIAEVISYDTETGVLVFDTPTIVSAPFNGANIAYTATLAVAEEVRATAAEETLQTNIDAEETARIAADANLQTQIDNISGSGGSGTMGGTMTSHIIPDSNAAYDLGNAEYKIRHLFLSDNSLWVGENHKISIGDDGKMKFRKRKNVLPKELRDEGVAPEPGASLKRIRELAHQNNMTFDELFLDADDFDEENDEVALTALQDQVAALESGWYSDDGFDVINDSDRNNPGSDYYKMFYLDNSLQLRTDGPAWLAKRGDEDSTVTIGWEFDPEAKLHVHDYVSGDKTNHNNSLLVESRDNGTAANNTLARFRYMEGNTGLITDSDTVLRIDGTGEIHSSQMTSMSDAITTEETRAAAAEVANATAITTEQTRATAAETANATAIAAITVPTNVSELTNDMKYTPSDNNGMLQIDVSSERGLAENFEGLDVSPSPGSPTTTIGSWINGEGDKDGHHWWHGNEWCVTGSTDYHTRGPSSPHSGDKYIFTDTLLVGERRANEYYTLIRHFPAAENIVSKLSFYYYGHGLYIMDSNDIPPFAIYISETGIPQANQWVQADITKDVDGTPSVVDFLGEEHTSADEPWKRAEVDLSAYAGKDLYIKFFANTGGSTKGEFAIDYIDFELNPYALYSKNGAVQATEFVGDGSKLTAVDYNNLTNVPTGTEQYYSDHFGDVKFTVDHVRASTIGTSGSVTAAIVLEEDHYAKFPLGFKYSPSVLPTPHRSQFNNMWLRVAKLEDPDSWTQTEGLNMTFLIGLAGDGNDDASFIVNVRYASTDTAPLVEGTPIISCEPLNATDLDGFDPTTDLVFNLGMANYNPDTWDSTDPPEWDGGLWIKSNYAGRTCHVSILGGNANRDASRTQDPWYIATDSTWQSELPSTGFAYRDDLYYGQWADKVFKDLTVNSLTVDGTIVDATQIATNATTIHAESLQRIAEDTATRNMIPDVSGFATTAQIPDVSGFATTAQIPDVSNLATTVELTVEETRATAAETANAIAITVEETRATAAETINASAITALQAKTDVSTHPNTGETFELYGDTVAYLNTWYYPNSYVYGIEQNVAALQAKTDVSTHPNTGETFELYGDTVAYLNTWYYPNSYVYGIEQNVAELQGKVAALEDGDLSLGGLSIAETYIHNTTSGTGTSTRYELTTAYQKLSSNHEVTFTAPANGKVKVKFIGMFSGIDSSVGTAVVGEEVYVRIKTGIFPVSYIQDISGVHWDGNKFMQTDESGNHTQLIEANVDGLTPGQSYTYEFEFKKGSDNTDVNLSFGADFPPTIIRVETLGTVSSFGS